MNPPVNPARSCCRIQNLFSGCVKIQYATCIAVNATKAATVQGNARLCDGVSPMGLTPRMLERSLN
jgi:hypothetical protein